MNIHAKKFDYWEINIKINFRRCKSPLNFPIMLKSNIHVVIVRKIKDDPFN